MRLHATVSREFAAQFQSAVSHATEAGHWEGELVGYRKGRVRVVMLSRWQRTCDAEGRPENFLLSNTDIRLWDRFLADAARNWRHNVEDLFSQHPDGVPALDRHGTVLSANPALSGLTIFACEDLIGRCLDALIGNIEAEGAHASESFLRTCRLRGIECRWLQ